MRTSTYGRPAQLFQYVKESRQTWGADYILKGALPWPRESALPARC